MWFVCKQPHWLKHQNYNPSQRHVYQERVFVWFQLISLYLISFISDNYISLIEKRLCFLKNKSQAKNLRPRTLTFEVAKAFPESSHLEPFQQKIFSLLHSKRTIKNYFQAIFFREALPILLLSISIVSYEVWLILHLFKKDAGHLHSLYIKMEMDTV